jgi:uncharacterized cupredoxin-like copper-binding protein
MLERGSGDQRPRRHAALRRIGVLAGVITVGLVAQACGVAGVGGMGSMGGGMMNGGMMGDGGRFEGATAAPPVDAAVGLRVVAGDMYFDPSQLQLTSGETVNLTLDNRGAAFHDFTVPELGFMLAADGGEQARGALAAVELGIYDFFCSVPGHVQAGMTGTLTVG